MKNNVIIVSAARSGTNFFLDCYGEVFPKTIRLKEIFRKKGDNLNLLSSILQIEENEILKIVNSNPKKLWTIITQKLEERNTNLIAKIFYYHADRKSDLWKHFHKENKVLHLIRRNPFDSLVSQHVATKTGVWQGRKETDNSGVRLQIDPAEANEFISKRTEQVKWAQHYFESADYTELFYEDLSKSTQTCCDMICEIFDIPPENSYSEVSIKKQNNIRHSERVENYAEVSHLDKEIF